MARSALLCSLAPALAILVYLPALKNGFIFDDYGEMGNFDGLFTPWSWPGLFFRAQYQLYRPIKYITLHFDHMTYGGMTAWGFHLTNLLLHAAACVALQFFLRRLGASPAAAAVGAVWFALQPVHAEPVVWVTARGAMLSAIGVFAAAGFYLKWRESGRLADLAAVGLAGAFAYFSKEDSLMLVPALVALEFCASGGGGPSSRRRLVPAMGLLGALAFLYVALRQSLLEGVEQGRWEHGWSGLLATLPVILARYLGQMVYPVTLVLEPPIDFTAGFGLAFWASLVLLAAATIPAFLPERRFAKYRLLYGWFVLFLVPTMGFIPINAPAADRFLYIPSAAGAMAAALLWDQVALSGPRLKRLVSTAGAALLLLFAFADLSYAPVWRDEIALWSYVVEVNPRSYRGWNNLAAQANIKKRPDQALEWAERSLAIKPDYIEAIVTRARAYDHLGRKDEAEGDYRRALAMNGTNENLLDLWADFLERTGRAPEADAVYDRLFQLRPRFVEARIRAGFLAIQNGNREKAILHWEAALQSDPSNTMARQNLERARQEQPKSAQK